MMVCNDQIQAYVAGVLGFRRGTDAAVHADDQANTFFFQRGERFHVQPVAFVKAVRDLRLNLATHMLQSLNKERCGSHAVYVIVAIHCHGFAALNGCSDAGHRYLHTLEQEWVQQGIDLSTQESPGICIGGIATVEQQLAQDGREGRQGGIGFRGDGGEQLPAFLIGHGEVGYLIGTEIKDLSADQHGAAALAQHVIYRAAEEDFLHGVAAVASHDG
jgi:hypothetical protein